MSCFSGKSRWGLSVHHSLNGTVSGKTEQARSASRKAARRFSSAPKRRSFVRERSRRFVKHGVGEVQLGAMDQQAGDGQVQRLVDGVGSLSTGQVQGIHRPGPLPLGLPGYVPA